MVFLDTSAIFAMADKADPNHGRAKRLFRRLLSANEQILLHNYVLLEAAALLQRRLSLDSALRFMEQATELDIHWIGADDHDAAVELLGTRSRRGLSLVDCASFVVMRQLGVKQAFAFDSDFETEGFELYRA